MNLNELTAISPLDGRYRSKVNSLAPYFSEYGWIHYRLRIEIEYLIELAGLSLPALEGLGAANYPKLRAIYEQFEEKDAQRIKEIESKTNHDVKAVEYYIKAQLPSLGLEAYQEFIHFGLTSQDINNTAIPLLWKDFLNNLYLPQIRQILDNIRQIARLWWEVPMLARTHGQPASPTRLGKELMVFVERVEVQLILLENLPISAKFGGATGNLNAHYVAYPEINWLAFADQFVARLGLKRQQYTTQVESYDGLGAHLDNIKRINTILIDLCRDIWHYISINYFKQKINQDEVGSSAMPHKVNPIDFENAEGNLGIANALLEHLSQKLPISRLQRDLTDSTVLRNLGVPVAHTHLALSSLRKGLGKLELNPAALEKDLEANWAVVAEAIQTILRREAYPEPYEALNALTRGNQEINQKVLHDFVEQLDIAEAIKKELKAITPFNYLGKTPPLPRG